jgi:hypothetical protein
VKEPSWLRFEDSEIISRAKRSLCFEQCAPDSMSGDTRTANGLVVSRTGDVTSLALRPQQLLPRGYVLLMPIAIQDAGYTGGAGGAGQGGHNGHASHDTLLIYESLQSSTVSRQSRVRSKLHRRLAKLLQVHIGVRPSACER